MAELINYSSIVDDLSMIIHNKTDVPLLNVVDNDESFGIIKLKMKKTKITKIPLFLLFTIDVTGSMVEMANTNNTKMYFLIQTFIRMIQYLGSQDSEIYVQINTFNQLVNTIVKPTLITSTSVIDIINTIKSLHPDGSTNIGLALQMASTDLNDYKAKNPTHQYGHIFMSDGEPTYGESSHTVLQSMVNSDFTNIFVGFGLSHNAALFNRFSEAKNAEYQFVDNLENTGLVYGETIHRFLYPALKSVKITIDNGLLYNWKTNKWVTELEDSVLVSETEKLYQFKTKMPDEVEMAVYGTICSLTEDSQIDKLPDQDVVELIDTAIPLPDLIDENGDYLNDLDLTNYMFRQRVQELLYQSRKSSTRESRAHRDEIKNSLRNLFRKMRRFMRENQLMNDPFMNLLCDDVSITYRTIGTSAGLLYTSARQNSQGRQTAYNVSTFSTNEDNDDNESVFDNFASTIKPVDRPILQRTITGIADIICNIPFPNIVSTQESESPQRTVQFVNSSNDTTSSDEEEIKMDNSDGYLSEDDLDNYKPSDNNTTCYSTPTVLNTMRSLSQR
jgi:hypothetical protein